MNEILFFVLAWIAGLALGILFFGGLWLTVRKTIASKMPALWILGSFVLRIGITLIGFYYVTQGNWKRLFVCLFGFIAARYIIIQLTRPHKEEKASIKKEAGYGA